MYDKIWGLVVTLLQDSFLSPILTYFPHFFSSQTYNVISLKDASVYRD